MRNWILTTCLLIGCIAGQLNAQNATDARLSELNALLVRDSTVWTFGGGVGFDFSQLLLLNPRVGSGENRVGVGGIGSAYANYAKERITWENFASLQLAAQKIGSGQDRPWLKNLDIFRIGSKLGYKFNNPKWSAALEFTLQSILLPTYEGNILRPTEANEALLARFMSPAFMTLSPGIDYKATPNLSFFLSPFAGKAVAVLDDRIAALGIHGNPVTRDADGVVISYENVDYQLGAFFKTLYTNKFMEDKLSLTTSLDLYSNYLRDPQNIDVLWKVDLGYAIWRNLSLNIATELFYDHDVLVQIDNANPPTLGRRVSFVEALFIKYNVVF